jgi:hypothetical protein
MQITQLPDTKRQNAMFLLHLQALKLLSFSRTPAKETRGRYSCFAFLYYLAELRNLSSGLNGVHGKQSAGVDGIAWIVQQV